MRIIIILAIIAILLIPTTVQADETLQTMPGGKVNTHLPLPKPERSANPTITVLMQDLTQCQWTTNGQSFVCVDVCGGMSVPYTVCSYD